jgi:hypothetical protein
VHNVGRQRIKQTSDRVLELFKVNGLIWLEVYEKMLNGVLKVEQETANDVVPNWIKTLVLGSCLDIGAEAGLLCHLD